jgi:heme/copper-type cytochrome/quinol oxidase subunit 3
MTAEATPAADSSRWAPDGLPASEVLDVRHLPTFAFSHRSIMWWATLGLMVIESTVFALAVMMYFYLRSLSATWPINAIPPDLLWGTVNTLILLLSAIPNHLAKREAERLNRVRARNWLLLCLLSAILFLAVRAFEFATLNVSWTLNAYGSIVWLLLGLHTVHLITDTIDTSVLTVLLYTGPLEGKRYVDVSENAAYWYFVVVSWLPIYAVIYWAPRW